MSDQKEWIRAYLNSTRFRLLSWASLGLAIAGLYLERYKVALFIAAGVVSMGATLPALLKENLRSRASSRDIIVIGGFALLVVVVAFLLVYFRR